MLKFGFYFIELLDEIRLSDALKTFAFAKFTSTFFYLPARHVYDLHLGALFSMGFALKTGVACPQR